MAIHSIGLSFFGPKKHVNNRGRYDYADFTKRLMVHKGDSDTPVYLKWRTASGDDMNASFDIALNYRVVPKATTDGGAISGWATDWSTWAEQVPASSCSPRPTDGEGGYQWSLDFAWLLNECGIRDFLILNGSFAFDNRYYDRIEFGVRIKSNYNISGVDEVIGVPGMETTSPRTDTTFILDYVPKYAIQRVYCDTLETVKVEYMCEGWKRSDDRFCIEAFSIDGEPALLSKPWGTITRTYNADTETAIGTAAFPVSALTDLPLGEQVALEIRFNPSYGATGEEFARASYSGECADGGANIPAILRDTRDGVLYIKADDTGGSSPIVSALMKLVGSEYHFDQQTADVGTWTAWPYLPRGKAARIKMIGIDEDGNVSSPATLNIGVDASAPVEVVSLRDSSARAMAKYDLAIGDDLVPEATNIKLAGRDRECAYYGAGGSAVWSLSASLVKNIAGAHDTEEAWRKAATSGDCVLLLSDGTRRVVSIGDVRFNRSHPSFTGISATLREVDA